jgi:MFS family permease
MVAVGLIEGVAEATASAGRILSGVLSDALRRRKPLIVLGYGLAALSKPMFPMAATVTGVFAARFVDRVGKGIRGAPRDALVADITPPALRGAAYGLRQALDSVGAFVGPLLAILLMWQLDGDVGAVFWAAVVPAVLAVAILIVAVREPEHPRPHHDRMPWSIAPIRRLPTAFWIVVGLAACFTLARFSEAFLVLRAADVGLATAYVPAVMVLMNVVYAGVAYPAGALADRVDRRSLLAVGLAALVSADLVLAGAARPLHVFVGTALWGAQMGLTQGLFAKLVADAAPAGSRATAFGVFNLTTAAALFLASALAGALWSAAGPEATFVVGAGCAALTAAGLLAVTPGRLPKHPPI